MAAIDAAFKHFQSGRLAEAEQVCRQLIHTHPSDSKAWHLLAVVHHETKQFAAAIDAIEKAIQLSPSLAQFHNTHGIILAGGGQHEQAVAAFQRALSLRSNYGEALNNLGVSHEARGSLKEAAEFLRRAIAINPQYADAHNNLGNVLRTQGRLQEAIGEHREAIRLKPGLVSAYSNLAIAYQDTGRADEAIACLRRRLELQPDSSKARSDLLLGFLYNESMTAAEIFEEHKKRGAMGKRTPLAPISHGNDRNPNRRLRIGYVSTDFREHPTARFILPILRCHDRESVEVYCYAHILRPDACTKVAEHDADVWRDITRLSDEKAAELIRSDRIDVLIDLSGHMAHNRLPIFAMRPAPVQASYCGYPFTTGVPQIDWRITDAHVDPHELPDSLYTEKLVRLPRCFLAYDPMADDLPVAESPAQRTGTITFAVLNRMAKVQPAMVRLWAKILEAVPHSRLMIKPGGEGEEHRSAIDFFAANGISRDRLHVVGKQRSRREYMELWNQADIALDTFPYHGTATTCDALWMGVPTITLAGDSCVSRTGVSLLRAIGCDDWVAKDEDEYVAKAIAMSSNRNSLAELRVGLRNRTKASALLDFHALSRALESAYRTMYEEWCEIQ